MIGAPPASYREVVEPDNCHPEYGIYASLRASILPNSYETRTVGSRWGISDSVPSL